MISRVQSIVKFGQDLQDLDTEPIVQQAHARNGWFTPESIRSAINGIVSMLNEADVKEFASRYQPTTNQKRIGLVLAGNIPLVGFHDVLCVLLSGHSAHVKLSSDDNILIPAFIEVLKETDPALADNILLVDKINQVDAVIATGSDNTSRYFEYYFRNIPHIIRKNRTSIAVLDGSESSEQLYQLGADIFQYYGLGCRNVSRLWVPEDYTFDGLFESIQPYESIIHNSKYVNNYDYNKSIYLVNKEPFLDNGFLLVKEDQGIVSPISVLYFERYSTSDEVQHWLEMNENKVQVVVSNMDISESVGFGQAQHPRIWDFADKVDTMEFLVNL